MENFIDGKWIKPHSAKYAAIQNPCTGEIIEKFACSDVIDVESALESSGKAFKNWKKTAVSTRASLQHKAANLMRSNAESLAKTIAEELGRPLAGCLTEITRSADLLDF
jgi:succinate-semialdehyde dehydrogenase/glutarate-semialdehyde dehydrogenase